MQMEVTAVNNSIFSAFNGIDVEDTGSKLDTLFCDGLFSLITKSALKVL
jgi:hypothetical protein